MYKARKFQKNIYLCFIAFTEVFDSVDHNKLWKILKNVRIPDHLSCLLTNQVKKQVRSSHGILDLFKIGKGVPQGCMWSPCLFNLHAENIMWNAGLYDYKLELRLWGEISTTSDMQMHISNGRKGRGTKTPWGRWKKRVEKTCLKLNIQKTKVEHGIWSHHFMANRWGGKGNSADFIILGSNINVDSVCSHRLKDICSLEEKLWQTWKWKWKLLSCVQLCNPKDYTVHGILGQNTGVGSVSLLQGIFQPRDQIQVSSIADKFFTSWSTGEAHDKPRKHIKNQRHHFTDKNPWSQSYGFSISYTHVIVGP